MDMNVHPIHCLVGNSRDIAADDFADIVVRISSLDKPDCKQGPIGPCKAVGHRRRLNEIVFRPERSERFSRRTPFGKFTILFAGILRGVRNVGADRLMINAEVFRDILEVIEECRNVAGATQEFGNAADAEVAAGVHNGSNHFIRLAADMRADRRPGADRHSEKCRSRQTPSMHRGTPAVPADP